jgi:hypothetical protein
MACRLLAVGAVALVTAATVAQPPSGSAPAPHRGGGLRRFDAVDLFDRGTR